MADKNEIMYLKNKIGIRVSWKFGWRGIILLGFFFHSSPSGAFLDIITKSVDLNYIAPKQEP